MSDALDLIDGIRQTRLANRLNFLPIRQLLRGLRFDETRPFQWRLEHKLIQAHVLNRYAPGVMPATAGLFGYLDGLSAKTEEAVREALSGVQVKRTLGSGATADDAEEKDRAVAGYLERPPVETDTALLDEQWVVQERLSIVEEYRVHTLENAVIPDLTFSRHENRPIRAEREAPNKFVESVVAKLPAPLLAETLCGWDVCRTASGSLIAIEVNFGGVHPEVEPGFQCSGMLATNPWGPYLVARLTRFVEKVYDVRVEWNPELDEPAFVRELYDWVARWHKLLEALAAVQGLNEEDLNLSLSDEFQEPAKVMSDITRRISKVADVIL